jgi:hypothetical protein
MWKTTSMEEDLNRNIWKSINFFNKIYGYYLEGPEIIFKSFKYGIQPQLKTTPMEDDLNERRPQYRVTSMVYPRKTVCGLQVRIVWDWASRMRKQ